MPLETLDEILSEIVQPSMVHVYRDRILNAYVRDTALKELFAGMLGVYESLKLGHKEKLVAPLMRRLKAATAARFSRQLRAIKQGKKVRFNDGSFQRVFARTTDLAYNNGARYAARGLGVFKEAGSYTTKRWPVGYALKAQQVESDLDKTTAEAITSIQALNPEVKGAALVKLIAAAFKDFRGARSEMIATHEISKAFHTGGADVARIVNEEQGGSYVTKSWQVQDDPCDICIENAGAGALSEDEQFPSGDAHPPAHVRCVCSIEYGRAQA